MQWASGSFVMCGALPRVRRPANGTGRLMMPAGFTWFVGDLQLGTDGTLFALAPAQHPPGPDS